MGTVYNEQPTQKVVNTSRDNIIIRDDKQVTLRGGRTVDTTGYADEAIYAGTPIIKETATGILKPLGNNGTAYNALPADHEFYCINNKSILKDTPYIGGMIGGTVNYKACYFNYNNILTAIKAALTDIHFYADKD